MISYVIEKFHKTGCSESLRIRLESKFIKGKIQNDEGRKKRDVVFQKNYVPREIGAPASCIVAIGANHYATPHPRLQCVENAFFKIKNYDKQKRKIVDVQIRLLKLSK